MAVTELVPRYQGVQYDTTNSQDILDMMNANLSQAGGWYNYVTDAATATVESEGSGEVRIEVRNDHNNNLLDYWTVLDGQWLVINGNGPVAQEFDPYVQRMFRTVPETQALLGIVP